MSRFTPSEIAADYRTLLEHGLVDKWELHNLAANECEPWWSARDDWGDTLVNARARHGVVPAGEDLL